MPAKEPGFMERLQTAAKAKKAQLEKIRASAAANSAKSTGRQAAQVEAAAARKIRTAGRKDSDRVGAEQREAQRAAENARQALAVVDEKARKEVERVPKQRPMPPLKRIRRLRATPNTPHVKFGRNRPARAIEPHTLRGVLSTECQALVGTYCERAHEVLTPSRHRPKPTTRDQAP